MDVGMTVMNTDNTIKRRFLHILRREGFPLSRLMLFNSSHDTKDGCAFHNGRVRMGLLRRGSSFGSVSVTFASTKTNASGRCTRSVAHCNTIVVSGSDTFHVSRSMPLIIPRYGTTSTLGHPHNVVTGPGYAAVVVIATLRPVRGLDPVGHVRITDCRTTDNTNTITVTRLRRRCHRILRKGPIAIGGFTCRLTCGMVPRVSMFRSGNCAGRRVGVFGRAHGVVRDSVRYSTVYIHIPTLHSRSRTV